MKINLDKDGNFSGTLTVKEWKNGAHWYSVGKYVDKTYTIDDWNKKQSNQQPAEDKPSKTN